MQIVLTGISGFVRQNLAPYLSARSIKVLSIDRSALSNISAELIDKNIAAIVHLAGKAHDLQKSSNPHEYYEANFELTKKLYNAFLKSDARKFIFISSVKAVADSIKGILDENIKPNPKTHYGKSKLMAEEYIISQALPNGKSYYILRPCMIHGPGNKGNLNLLYKFVKKGIPYPLAGFENRRSFLSVENLCFVINELITRDDISGGIYQVADDEALSTNEVVYLMASQLNTAPKLWKIAPPIIKFCAKIGDILHLPLTTDRLNKLTENYVVSNKKIKVAIGKELPLTATKGLEITAISFKEFDSKSN
jgi:nucleoside-diphosphate-sugar epimerase